jgi:anti-sigma factor RsiW
MKVERSPLICDRVRSQVSMLLDGELSVLEGRIVDAHLRRCADCGAFEAEVRRFTEELRSAPLEAPREPIVIKRPRRASFTAAQLGAAATLAIAVFGAVSQFGVLEPDRATGAAATAKLFNASWQPEEEMAQLADAGERTDDTNRPGPISAL